MIQISAWIRCLLVSNEAVMSRTKKPLNTVLHLWITSSGEAIATSEVSEMQIMNTTISTVVGFQAMRFGSRATRQPTASAMTVSIAQGRLLAGPHSSLWGLMNEIHDQSSTPTNGRIVTTGRSMSISTKKASERMGQSRSPAWPCRIIPSAEREDLPPVPAARSSGPTRGSAHRSAIPVGTVRVGATSICSIAGITASSSAHPASPGRRSSH